MSEPFERTTRYLTADGAGLAWAGAIAGLLIAALWLAWLFLAQVPLSVQAGVARPAAGGLYTVTLDQADVARVRPGQRATLRPEVQDGATAPTLAAYVAEVDAPAGQVQIELEDAAQRPAGGTVWIVTEHISPAVFIVRAVEQAFVAH